ncbi:MAG TPA: aromatic ring-hydroxylating dioxygenase subunit alpha [Paraburkholderia sp.]
MTDIEPDRFDAHIHWYPVAASREVGDGRIVQSFLDGHELALWRSADGVAHAWENRCPHRGTRFSLGWIDGDTLSCAYHGWRFGKDGACTYIPAKPKLSPPRSACAKTYAVREEGGLIWATLGDASWRGIGDVRMPNAFCRSFVVYRSPRVTRAFLRDHFAAVCMDGAMMERRDESGARHVLFLQPISDEQTVLYLWIDTEDEAGSAAHIEATLRAAHAFKALHTQLEADVQYASVGSRTMSDARHQATQDGAPVDEWFVVSAAARVGTTPLRTALLGRPLAVWRDALTGEPVAAPDTGVPERHHAIDRYGYTWVALAEPRRALFTLPQYDQPGRRIVDCGAFGVHTSGPRVIENFLDMGHFPYVHAGILGEEPHTEVKDYKVHEDEHGELWATDCAFWQPRAAAAADAGMDVDYAYRVPNPFCALLYKTSPRMPAERDVIALFVQPLSEVESRVHFLMLLFDDEHDNRALVSFQQTIFGQDKPILESQLPKRLPLDARAEVSTRADAMSMAYRRWLKARGLGYGVEVKSSR